MMYGEINGHRVKYGTKLHKTYLYMLNVGYITSMVAFEKLKNTRLSATIYELKHRYAVDIQVEYVPYDGTVYAKYYLKQEYINRRKFEANIRYKLEV